MPEKSGPTGKFDTGLIRELAAILRDADLGEIEIEQGDLRIRVSKPDAAPITYSAAAPIAAPAPVSHVAASPAATVAAATTTAPSDHPGAVKSPMVGTVYLSPEAGAPAFVKVGDTVKAGQTLLLVEAMKTFNPVPAPRGGTVTKLLVANEQPVEFGEPLVIIE